MENTGSYLRHRVGLTGLHIWDKKVRYNLQSSLLLPGLKIRGRNENVFHIPQPEGDNDNCPRMVRFCACVICF